MVRGNFDSFQISYFCSTLTDIAKKEPKITNTLMLCRRAQIILKYRTSKLGQNIHFQSRLIILSENRATPQTLGKLKQKVSCPFFCLLFYDLNTGNFFLPWLMVKIWCRSYVYSIIIYTGIYRKRIRNSLLNTTIPCFCSEFLGL